MNKNFRLLKITSFLVGCNFFLPILVLFYDEQLNLSFAEFMLCETVFVLTALLMEVPSGYISDIFKRKFSLILYSVFYLCGLFMLVSADGLLDAMMAEFLLGLALSFMTGTITAFTYDTALEHGVEEKARQLEGSRHAMSFYAIALCSVIGGFLYKVDPYLPLYLTVGATVLLLIVTTQLTEPKRHMQAPEKSIIKDILGTVHYALHGHAEIARLILLGGVIFTVTKLTLWTQQPYYMKLGFDPALFGILMAGGMLLNGISSHAGHFFDRFLGGRHGFYRLVMVQAALFALAAGNLMGTGVFFLLLCVAIYGLGYPCLQTSINTLVDSTRRATILSCSGLVICLFQGIFSMPYGILVDHYGVNEAMFIVSVLLLVFCVLLWLFDLYARSKKKHTAPIEIEAV